MKTRLIAFLLTFCMLAATLCAFAFTASADENERPLYGDVNGDGKIKGNDVTTLLKKLSGWDVKINEETADATGEGKVNGRDATMLLKYLSGWRVYLGPLYFGNTLILGDSISTYEGWISPEYNCYYRADYSWVEEKDRVYYGDFYSDGRTDLSDVDQMWWKMLIDETGSNFVYNDSVSGSAISYSGYGYISNADYDALDDAGKAGYVRIAAEDRYWFSTEITEKSFLKRFDKLVASGMFEENKIDTVFIFGLTNDCWCGYKLGKPKYEDRTEEDLYEALPATCELIENIKAALPDARIVFVENAKLNNVVIKNLPKICEHYNIELVELSSIKTLNGHPTVEGMESIRDQIMTTLMN